MSRFSSNHERQIYRTQEITGLCCQVLGVSLFTFESALLGTVVLLNGVRLSEDERLVAGLALLAGVLDLFLPRAVRGAQRDPDHQPREGGADDRGRGGAEEALEGRGNLEKNRIRFVDARF